MPHRSEAERASSTPSIGACSQVDGAPGALARGPAALAALGDELLERVEERDVVRLGSGLAGRLAVARDRAHEVLAEALPRKPEPLQHDDPHAERAPVPDLVED